MRATGHIKNLFLHNESLPIRYSNFPLSTVPQMNSKERDFINAVKAKPSPLVSIQEKL